MSIIEMKVPTIGESINEVTLSQWLKPNGSIINLDDPICEFESDKATLEFPAEAAGKLIYAAEEGQDLKIGDLVARIDTSFAGKEEKAETKEAKTEAPAAEKPAVLAKAVETSSSYAVGSPSPAASKILAEKGVDAGAVKGSGKDEVAKYLNYLLNTPTCLHSYNIASALNFTPVPFMISKR